MRLRDLIRPAGLLLVAGLLTSAAAAAADPVQLIGTAGLAHSERLRLRAWGDALARVPGQPGLTQRMRLEMTRQGYFHDGGRPEITDHQLQVRPLIAYDGNINGGVLQSSFAIPGGVLVADPAWRAKAGIVMGAGAGGAVRLAWGTGRVIDLAGGLEGGWSPQHRLWRLDASLSLCARNHISGWSFLDFCAAGSRSWRQLDNSTSHRLSVRGSQLLAGRNSLHELGAGLERVSTRGGPQSRLTLSAESVFSRAVTDFSVTLGAPVDGTTVLRQRVSAGYGWIAGGRSWRLDVSHQRLNGGAFLQTPRIDQVSGAGLTIALRPDIDLRLGVLRSRSTAGIANYRQITADLRFSSWSSAR